MRLFIIILIFFLSSCTVTRRATATLDESDAKGQNLGATWIVKGIPPGPVTFTSTVGLKTEMTVITPGDYYVTCTLYDAKGNKVVTNWVIHAIK